MTSHFSALADPEPSSQAVLPMSPSSMDWPFGLSMRMLKYILKPRLHINPQDIETVRNHSKTHTIVYLLQGQHIVLGFALHLILQENRLPMPTFVGGMPYRLLQPIKRWWHYLWQKTELWNNLPRISIPSSNDASAVIRSLSPKENLFVARCLKGEPVLIAQSPTPTPSGWLDDNNDYIQALIVAASKFKHPVVILPWLLVNHEQGGQSSTSPLQSLWGSQRAPGFFRELYYFFQSSRNRLQLAEPIYFKEFYQKHKQWDAHGKALALRTELELHWHQAQCSIAGPPLPTFADIQKRIFATQSVMDQIKKACIERQESTLAIEHRAAKMLNELAARYHVSGIKRFEQTLGFIFRYLFESIRIDREGLSHTVDVMRKAVVIFCPSHRSHMDYLLLSYLMWHAGLTPPHIAAGDNLAFFPMGPLFRSAGAFFIRRSFRQDKLYSSILQAYIHELLRNGTSLEVFLEGTRSRTGKLCPPKFGLLSMIVEAFRQHVCKDIAFIPVTLDYEQTPEAKSYTQEIQGAEKKQENIWRLIQSTALLKGRYGHISIRFGKPIIMSEFIQENPQTKTKDSDKDNFTYWRTTTEHLGVAILKSIQRHSSIRTKHIVATTALQPTQEPLPGAYFVEQTKECLELISYAVKPLEIPDRHIHREISQFIKEKKISVIPNHARNFLCAYLQASKHKRIPLDYEKNGLVPHMSLWAIAARIILLHEGRALTPAQFLQHTTMLSEILSDEFIYARYPGSSFIEIYENMLAYNIIAENQGHLRGKDMRKLRFLSNMLGNFIEAYGTIWPILLAIPFEDHQKNILKTCLDFIQSGLQNGNLYFSEATNKFTVTTSIRSAIRLNFLSEHYVSQDGILRLKVNPEHKQKFSQYSNFLQHLMRVQY